MRLGRDALVLTQTADSRSIAFLSQSLNQGKDVWQALLDIYFILIPIFRYALFVNVNLDFFNSILPDATIVQNVEIPVVSYYRKGQFMELDINIQSEAIAKYNLKNIKEFSPFDKYLIGEKAGLFRDKCTGTQIYVWNLDEWGSDYCLEWHNGLNGGSSFHQGDILIRSRRIRSRTGQISQKVGILF